ncbi:MAG TPA: four helix bundle protein [Thermoanaerobaculia bacterium]|jgi:four helix bundle protein|nr:four helix bundle protein [Thermoanaerobaculia bacterium]
MAKTLHDLVAYTRALDLIVDVYAVTASFPKDERFGLVAQLRRSAVGIAAQIAEGEGRLTNGERRQFLSQARGSLFEVEAEAEVASRLGFLSAADAQRISSGIKKTGKALIGFIHWVQKQERKTKSQRNPATAQPRNSETPPQPRRNQVTEAPQ